MQLITIARVRQDKSTTYELCITFIYVRLQHSMKALFFSRNINLTSPRLDFRTALAFFEYLVLIKITLGVHLLLGIDSVMKNLFKVLNTYKKRSFHLRSNSKRYKEFNLLHVFLFSIFCWASWPTNSARLASASHAQKWEGRGGGRKARKLVEE